MRQGGLDASFAFPLRADGLLVFLGCRVGGFNLAGEFAESVVELLVEFGVGHGDAADGAVRADVDHDASLAPE